jgi:hypothetical protein
MRRSASVVMIVAALAVLAPGGFTRPAPARAGIGGLACKVLGTVGEGWWGKACNAALSVGGKVTGGGKKAAGVVGKVAANPLVQRGAGIAAIVAWVLGGAKWTIDHMGAVISQTTSPTLTAGWFTGVYLRVEGLALFFTLLFICAAACEAVLRSDTAVLARAVFGYLPLAALLTAVAAPLVMLMLAATDELSVGLEAIAGQGATHFLTGTGAWVAAGLTVADPFFAVIAGGLVVAAGGALWVEMLIREIAVYLVVAMLPVVFASMVWPARRVWAIRTVEVLVALILSKVAIVCVLALGGAALQHAGAGSLSRLLGGLALIILGAFSPWLLLRLIPMAEVASAAVGHFRGHVHASAGIRTPEAALAGQAAARATGRHNGHHDAEGATGAVAVQELLEQMHRRARTAENGAHGNGREPMATAHESATAEDARGTPGEENGQASGAGETAVILTREDASASSARARQGPEPPAGSDAAGPVGPYDRDAPPALAGEDAPSAPPPMPAPQDGRLSADDDREPGKPGGGS